MNIYVSNLGFNVQDSDLKDFFSSHGDVTSARVITDKVSGRSRGFGFVEMPDTAAATQAIAALDNSKMDGRQIGVSEARPRESGSYGNASSSANNRGKSNKSPWQS